jgi:thioredoxin reductase (NADPH)
METLAAAIIAALVTLLFLRGYLKQITSAQRIPKAGGTAVSASPIVAAASRPCPRCAKAIGIDSSFCPHCGAAMTLWTVHEAEVQTATGDPSTKGKPKPLINAVLCVGCGSCVDDCPETGTLELVAGKAILAHPERCTGQAKCTQVCPTNAITLSFGGVLQTVRVPRVQPNFETNLPGIFIAGELAGMGLIKTAINEGKLVMDHLKTRLAAGLPPDDRSAADADVIIVGAGPAGLSASLTAEQYGLRYLTLEQGEIASTIRQYPRQKFLMAEPIELPLYGTLYVADGTKEALLSVWETILANTGVRVRTNERVEAVQRNARGFAVTTAKGLYHAPYVVLAMGKRGTPRRLGVPGEDLSKVSYKLIEAGDYQNKDLLVVGGGDSAIEAALALSRAGTNRVTLSCRGDSFQRARDRNRLYIEKAVREGTLKVMWKSQVTEIRNGSVILACDGNATSLPNDYTFVLIGGETPEDFLRRTGIEIVEKALSAASLSHQESLNAPSTGAASM